MQFLPTGAISTPITGEFVQCREFHCWLAIKINLNYMPSPMNMWAKGVNRTALLKWQQPTHFISRKSVLSRSDWNKSTNGKAYNRNWFSVWEPARTTHFGMYNLWVFEHLLLSKSQTVWKSPKNENDENLISIPLNTWNTFHFIRQKDFLVHIDRKTYRLVFANT